MNFNIFKKLTALLVLISVISPIGATFQKKEAKAVSVHVLGGHLDFVTSITSLPSVDASIATIAAATTAETTQQSFEWAQSFILETLKKRLLDMMVDDIIQWVNGGDSPRFVTDWSLFLEDAANVAIGDLAIELGAGFLCSPFSAQLRVMLAPDTNFRNQATCTLDDIVGNIENFYADFQNGGWVAYQAAWEPQNNIFGSYLLLEEEKYKRIAAAQTNALEDARAGDGFLGTRSCEEGGGDGPDIDGDGNKGDIASTCTITTPGSVVGDIVKDAVGVDFDFIVNADQLSEYAGAIANALFNRLVRTGVSGLRGLTRNDGQGSDFTIITGGGSACFGLTGSVLAACQSYQGSIGAPFENAREDMLSDIATSINIYREIVTITQEESELWQEYEEDLEDKPSFCDVEDELAGTRARLNTLSIKETTLGSTITQLEAFEDEIEALPADGDSSDWSELMSLQLEVSSLATPSLVEAQKTEAQASYNAADNYIDQQQFQC